MFVLVFTLITGMTGPTALYSGDVENRQTGKPTLFQTQALCEEVRASQLLKLAASREADPKLPAFKLECLNLETAPASVKGMVV